jgi:hypothetical protein
MADPVIQIGLEMVKQGKFDAYKKVSRNENPVQLTWDSDDDGDTSNMDFVQGLLVGPKISFDLHVTYEPYVTNKEKKEVSVRFVPKNGTENGSILFKADPVPSGKRFHLSFTITTNRGEKTFTVGQSEKGNLIIEFGDRDMPLLSGRIVWEGSFVGVITHLVATLLD